MKGSWNPRQHEVEELFDRGSEQEIEEYLRRESARIREKWTDQDYARSLGIPLPGPVELIVVRGIPGKREY